MKYNPTSQKKKKRKEKEKVYVYWYKTIFKIFCCGKKQGLEKNE